MVQGADTQADDELMKTIDEIIKEGVDLYDATLKPAPLPTPEVAVLSQAEQDSALWSKIRGALELMLNNYRIQNDNAQGELATAELRGRIRQVKEFLALGEPPILEENPELPDLGY